MMGFGKLIGNKAWSDDPEGASDHGSHAQQQECVLSGEEARRPLALLVGFTQPTLGWLLRDLSRAGYAPIDGATSGFALELTATTEFALIAIDDQNVDDYGPRLISTFRTQDGPSTGARIVAVAHFMPAGLKAQLLEAGADAAVVLLAEHEGSEEALSLLLGC